MQSFVLRRDCNGHKRPKIFWKNIPKVWWWFDCTRSTCALRAVLSIYNNHLSQLYISKHLLIRHVDWNDWITLEGIWSLESFTSKVVIHLCSCLLSVVSVLEVQNGNVQAWAAEQLLDSGRQWEHTALRWRLMEGNPKQPTRDVYFTWDPYRM